MLKMLCAFGFIVLMMFPPVAPAQTTKGNILFTPKNADPVMFSHDYHIKTRGVKCAACHFRTFANSANGFDMKKEKLTKRDFCEHCHNGLKGFDATSEKNCGKCHKKQ